MSLPRQRRRHPAAALEGATGAVELSVAGTCTEAAGTELDEATAARDPVASNDELFSGAEDGRVVRAGARDVTVAIPASLPDYSTREIAKKAAKFKELSAAILAGAS